MTKYINVVTLILASLLVFVSCKPQPNSSEAASNQTQEDTGTKSAAEVEAQQDSDPLAAYRNRPASEPPRQNTAPRMPSTSDMADAVQYFILLTEGYSEAPSTEEQLELYDKAKAWFSKLQVNNYALDDAIYDAFFLRVRNGYIARGSPKALKETSEEYAQLMEQYFPNALASLQPTVEAAFNDPKTTPLQMWQALEPIKSEMDRAKKITQTKQQMQTNLGYALMGADGQNFSSREDRVKEMMRHISTSGHYFSVWEALKEHQPDLTLEGLVNDYIDSHVNKHKAKLSAHYLKHKDHFGSPEAWCEGPGDGMFATKEILKWEPDFNCVQFARSL